MHAEIRIKHSGQIHVIIWETVGFFCHVKHQFTYSGDLDSCRVLCEQEGYRIGSVKDDRKA